MRDLIRSADRSDREGREKFVDGVFEAQDPRGFLLRLLDQTPDESYADDMLEHATLDSLREKLSARREKIRFIFEHIEELAGKIADLYVETCSEFALNPKEVNIYVVGGRILQKPLRHSSDVDVVFTTDDQTLSLQSDKAKDPAEVYARKQQGQAEFLKKLKSFLEEYNLVEPTDTMNGLLIEPKGYGMSDSFVRQFWKTSIDANPIDDRRAVLIYKRQI
jgi:hypothetical protein